MKKPKDKLSWWKRWRHYYYLRLLRLKDNPNAMARGLAIGVFAGCLPLFGLQTIIGIVLATLFRGNKVLAAAATWISNPLTYLPLFVFNFKVGKSLLGWHDLSVTVIIEKFQQPTASIAWELGPSLLFSLLIGCLVVGLLAALSTYFISLAILKR